MQLIRNIKKLKNIKSPLVTLGNFDGVHLGHQRVLKAVKKRAEKLKLPSVVYTFVPHPLKVVAPHMSPPLLTTLEEKMGLIKSFGIDYSILAHFTKEFAAQHPREFAKNILVGQLRVKEVVVGHDYAFGKGKEGTIGYLKDLGRELDFRVRVIPAYKKKGIIVSSSRIREYIQAGRVEDAAGFLGRPYAVSGRIVRGRNVGRGLGFPTANLEINSELAPKNGVYAVRIGLGRNIYNGVANIGFAPTFGKNKFALEVHIMDFNRRIYGKELKVEFIKRLRDEKTFKDAGSLAFQIKRDIDMAKRALEGRLNKPQ